MSFGVCALRCLSISASASRISKFSVVSVLNRTQSKSSKCVRGLVPARYMSETKASPEAAEEVKGSEEAKVEETPEFKKLIDEKEKLDAEIKDVKDKYLRALAETENVRQRMKKQVDEAKLFGIQGFCKDLLEMADILETAVGSVSAEELSSGGPVLTSLHQGVVMTNSQLHTVFSRHGLLKIVPAVGEKFDPNVHEALFNVPRGEGVPDPGTVAIMQKTGYCLKERTLRPALVGVAAE